MMAQHIVVAKDALQAALSIARQSAGKVSGFPALSHVLIQPEAPSALRVYASDLDHAVAASVPAEVQPGARAVALPADILHKYVSMAAAAQVSISVSDRLKAEIVSGQGRARIPGIPDTEMPHPPESPDTEPVRIQAGRLTEMIRLASIAIYDADGRGAFYRLDGAMLEAKPDSIALYATDGRRMAAVRAEADPGSGEVLLPLKLMRVLVRAERMMGDTVEIRYDDRHIYAASGAVSAWCRRIEGRFPDRDRVMAYAWHGSATVQREEMLSALRRLRALVGGDRCSVLMRLGSDSIAMSAGAANGAQEGEDAVSATDASGPGAKVCANADFLIEYLAAARAADVRIEWTDHQSPVRLSSCHDGIGYTYIVMPIVQR